MAERDEENNINEQENPEEYSEYEGPNEQKTSFQEVVV